MTSAVEGKRDINHLLAAITLGVIAFSIPMPIRVNSVLGVSLFVIYLGYALVKRHDIVSFFKSPLFMLIGFQMLMQLVGLIHSPDMTQGLADVERFSFALLLPFLIYLLGKHNGRFGYAMVGFITGCFGLILYGFIHTLFIASDDGRSQTLSNGHTFFTDPLHLHPFYLSIYLIFILFYLSERLRIDPRWRSGSKLILVVIGITSIILMIFFLRAQIALLLFVLLVVLYLLILFKRRAAMVTFLFFGVGLIVYLLDTERVMTFFDTYGKNVSTAVANRHQVWKGALVAIAEAPVFGVGTGGEQLSLNDSYRKIGFEEGVTQNYNAHNQYLEFVVRNGMIELACFLMLIVYCFKHAARDRLNYLFLLFMMMFCLSMIAESFLSVQKGIVFFYCFASAFIFLPVHGLNDDNS